MSYVCCKGAAHTTAQPFNALYFLHTHIICSAFVIALNQKVVARKWKSAENNEFKYIDQSAAEFLLLAAEVVNGIVK